MKIGFDLDAVLFDYHKAFKLMAEDLGWHHRDKITPPTQWEVWKDWGITKDEWWAFAHLAARHGLYLALPPAEDALWALKSLKSRGHSVHIITDRRGKFAREDTITWLDEHKLPYDSITFAKDKTIAAVDFFLDDKTENVETMLRAGAQAVLMSHPWNETAPLPRVDSLTEYVELIEDAELIASWGADSGSDTAWEVDNIG